MENHPDEDMNPRFFQFIISQRMTKELRIPKTFEIHMEGKTSGIVSLKAPNTNIWRVNLVENDQGLFLQKGWEGFVRDHSISIGDCLVFRYDGNMLFNVEILDKTTCAKEDAIYVKPSRGKGTVGDSHHAKRKPGRQIPRCTAVTRDKERALREAMNFRTEKPIATVVMKKGYIENGHLLRLPVAFCRSSLPKVTQTMTLYDPRARAWETRYIYSVTRGYGSGLLSAGWKKFATANDLQMDDVCVFEVIEHNKMQFCHPFEYF
ncbi:hypothetical protein H6P81_008119 [Aristolochia fimbriata]|uniref:TF-B3 domain-containing protein n=1 Tax=Aristolochia fimbriata TaxID=158543 RepID=A0AAV7F4G7_ARIFI|nr:hypothetical protein H6P81_008119 [Aristolochia fimbriata]